MKLLLFLMLLPFFLSCESRRVLFITEFYDVDYKKGDFMEILNRHRPTVDMNKVLNGISNSCFGVDIDNPVYFCRKRHKFIVLSFYKITDNKKSFDLEHFYNEDRNKFEQESLEVHKKIVLDFSIKFSVQANNRLIKKEEMRRVLEYYEN